MRESGFGSISDDPPVSSGPWPMQVLIKQEQSGEIRFCYVENDGSDQNMMFLTGLKNIFSKQLPNMPKVDDHCVPHISASTEGRPPHAPLDHTFQCLCPCYTHHTLQEYICRLVFDRRHRSTALVKRNGTVMGGITYRAFPHQVGSAIHTLWAQMLGELCH